MSKDVELDLDEMNHSEIVALCHWIGMKNVSRGIPRDFIVQSLRNMDEISLHNPVDDKRLSLSNWMKRHWSIIEMQVIKSECPNCTRCADVQVVECFEDNKRHFHAGC